VFSYIWLALTLILMRFFLLIITCVFSLNSIFSANLVAECDSLQSEIIFESSDFSITINIDPNLLVDQYKFRYRQLGSTTWDGVVVIGLVDGQSQLTSTKTITGLLSCVEYEIQQRIIATDGCDSGWLGSETAFTSITTLINISGCDSVQVIENESYYNQSGFYTDTLISSFGCDSIILANVTVNNYYQGDTIFENSCDIFEWNQITYNQTGVYEQVFTGINGCDSIEVLNLTINFSEIYTDTQVHCDSFEWENGVTYTESNNTAINFLQNSQGCDSIIELDLIINESYNSVFNQTVCNANSFTWNDSVYTQSGEYIYTYTNTNGCDSSLTLNLAIIDYPELELSANNYSITVELEPENFVDQYKFRYRQLGTFSWISVGVIGTINGSGQLDSMKTFTNGISECTSYEIQSRVISNDGCDSGWNPVLETITTSSIFVESVTACDSIQFSPDYPYYVSSGMYEEIYSSDFGCDSIVIYDLTVFQTSFGDTLDIIECDNYNWNNQDYTTSGFYIDTLVNSQGCDSIVYLQLEIFNSSTFTDVQEHCDTFIWQDGNIYNQSNSSAQFVVSNSFNCDSVITLDLSIKNSTSSTESVLICEPSYFWNDSLYTENGTYEFVTLNSVGCDSTATLNLLLSTNSIVTESVDACDSYTWNDSIYSTSGIYEYITINAAGCDSLSYLDLNLGFSNEINQTITACDFYTVSYPLLSGEIIEFNITENTSVSYTILNSQMCDSTINLEIIISDSVYQSFSQIEQCSSYTWNGVEYSESGIYSFESTSSIGCDSIAILELIIIPNESTEDYQTHCDSYTWTDNVTYTESTNTPFLTYQSDSGCDSIVTLNLIILESTSSSIDIDVCDQYTWNGDTYSNSGQYSFETTGSQGCDSVAVLNLSVSQLSNLNVSGLTEVEVGSSSNYSILNSSGSTYQWQLSSLGNISSGQGTNLVNILWNQEGEASVCVIETDQNGCEGQQSCVDVTISELVNLNEWSNLSGAKVYPNPFKNQLNIDFQTKEKRQILLLDLQGRVVYSNEINSENTVISSNNLNSGSYLLKIISEKEEINKSVILD